jgi:PqqD family protein of HPr-rel-A system
MDRPLPSADVSLQRVGNEAILHDRRNGRAHVLNDSAARVWQLCDGRATLDEIVSAFAASYDMPPADVREDVVYILSKFRELRVLD